MSPKFSRVFRWALLCLFILMFITLFFIDGPMEPWSDKKIQRAVTKLELSVRDCVIGKLSGGVIHRRSFEEASSACEHQDTASHQARVLEKLGAAAVD